jgi:hypothetical protein
MNKPLINGNQQIQSFLGLLNSNRIAANTARLLSQLNGPTGGGAIPMSMQMRLPELFNPALNSSKYQQIYNGNLSAFGNDHSDADFALTGYLARRGLNPSEVDQVFRSSRLYRPKWDERRGSSTYGGLTIHSIFKTLSKEKINPTHQATETVVRSPIIKLHPPSSYKPVFIPNGMSSRRFIGPSISKGVRLFPANALSTLVALGAMGKTSLLISIAAHVAAGKDWNDAPLEQQKVAMFFCEEDKDEINRKFSALTETWSANDRNAAIDNLLLIPLLGIDARLTIIDKGHYRGSGFTEEMIKLLIQHKLKDGLVILDHMQGFTAGDLNVSETATAISREANKIVQSTGAAVVLAAHISKANIKATEVEQGFAVGSLAFENATRQLSGLISMSEEQGKKLGVEATRKEYVWLSLAKNSYGENNEGLWLKKVYSPLYHTIKLEPIILTAPIPAAKLSENQKLERRIIDYVNNHPFTTRARLDAISGLDGILKASKSRVRDCVKGLIDSGQIEARKVTERERVENRIPKQVNDVLVPILLKPVNMQADHRIVGIQSADIGPIK